MGKFGFEGLLPKWSGLRSLGQSRLVALTALVPFIGSFILFNQYIVDFITISPKLVGHWLNLSDQAAVGESQSFTLNRLVLTYFGLIGVGLASFLFALFCPTQIKKNASVFEHVESEKSLVTPARTVILVSEAVNDYLFCYGEEEKRGPEFLRELAYPFELVMLFEQVIRQISMASIEGIDADIYSLNGNIYIDKVARVLSVQRRAERSVWGSFHSEAQNYSTDLLSLNYEAKDHAKPILRGIVAGLYAIGFSILFFPTALTMLQIIKRSLLF